MPLLNQEGKMDFCDSCDGVKATKKCLLEKMLAEDADLLRVFYLMISRVAVN